MAHRVRCLDDPNGLPFKASWGTVTAMHATPKRLNSKGSTST